MTTQQQMKVAISSWQGRISPVFDVARQVDLADVRDGVVLERRRMALPDDPIDKVESLCSTMVNCLVCGAISRPLHGRLTQCGIRVRAFVAGEVDDVLDALLADRLGEPAYAMPGCFGGLRRRHRGQAGGGSCRCPRCGREQPHIAGEPCRNQLCPACRTPMIRT